MGGFGELDKGALDRYITGNYGEDQFKPHHNGCPAHEDAALLSDCCGATAVDDTDVCSACQEHAGFSVGECQCDEIWQAFCEEA